MHPPAISVLVPTYGRTRVLSECVHSFMQQQYSGLVEMIVLNDHPDQELMLDSTAVWSERPVLIVNVSERIQDLGTKRNALVQMATHDLVTFWDDDDVYLSGALAALAGLYQRHSPRRCARMSHVWQLQTPTAPKRTRGFGSAIPMPELGDSAEIVLRDSGCLWNCVMERTIIGGVGGFPADDRFQDCSLLDKLIRARHVLAETNTPGVPQCIRRLTHTGYPHSVDASWNSDADNDASAEHMRGAVSALIASGQEPSGSITITPRWQHDYEAVIKRCWDMQGPNRKLPIPVASRQG